MTKMGKVLLLVAIAVGAGAVMGVEASASVGPAAEAGIAIRGECASGEASKPVTPGTIVLAAAGGLMMLRRKPAA